MSAPWPTTAAAPARPSLPVGAIAQANAATPATPNAAAPAPPAAAPPQAILGAQAQVQANGTASPSVLSNGSVAPAAVAGGPVTGAQQAVAMNQNGKRELSPDRAAGGAMPPQKTIKSTHGEDVKPTLPSSAASTSTTPATPSVQFLPMGRGQGIDLRAEEENQRRAARNATGGVRYTGANRAKHTDLFGERALRMRLHQIAQEHAMTVDDEAMRYLALAAEVRVRALLSSAVRAQEHRVLSTHKHVPPVQAHPAAGAAPRPLWSQKITSDPNAVLAALEAANKEETKAHRIARTEWKARETEMARALAAQREQEERERESEGGNAPAPAVDSPAAEDADAGSTRAASASTPKAPTFQAAPTFGAPPPKKTSKSKKAGAKDSEAVQQKLTNIAAMKAYGRKQYAWETGGSPASWKTKKEKKEKKEKEEEEGATPVPEVIKPKRPRRRLTSPKPREVDVAAPGDRRSNDRQALTLADMVFALEHDGERGMGSSEEIARRVWLRPGGPYGLGR